MNAVRVVTQRVTGGIWGIQRNMLRFSSAKSASFTQEEMLKKKDKFLSCFQKAEYSKALVECVDLVEYCRTSLGETHPSYASWLNNLALVYKSSGDIASAIPIYEKGVEKYLESHGKEHPSTATALNNLAIAYQQNGQHSDAKSCFKTACEIREKCLGEDHVDTALSFASLGNFLRELGEFESAQQYFEKALNVYEKSGNSSLQFASCIHNYGILKAHQQQNGEAEDLYLKSFEMRKQILVRNEQSGLEHGDIEDSLNTLASLYNTTNQYDKLA